MVFLIALYINLTLALQALRNQAEPNLHNANKSILLIKNHFSKGISTASYWLLAARSALFFTKIRPRVTLGRMIMKDMFVYTPATTAENLLETHQ